MVLLVGSVFFLGWAASLVSKSYELSDWGLLIQNVLISGLFISTSVTASFHLLKKYSWAIWAAFPLSFVVLGCGVYILGLLSILNSTSLIIFWLLLILPEMMSRFSFLRSIWRLEWKLKYISFVVASFAVLLFAWTSSEKVAASFPQIACDVSLIHLSVPQVNLQNGCLTHAWWLRGPWHPQLVHSLYQGVLLFGKALQMRADLLPAFLNSWFLLSLAAFAFGVFGGSALWSGFLVLLTPLTIYSLRISYLDIGNSLFVVSSFLSFVLWFRDRALGAFVLMGIFAGAAFATKHMGGGFVFVMIAPLLVFAIAYEFVSGRGKVTTQAILLSALACASILFLFYHQNFLMADGNPLFPFMGYRENRFYWSESSVRSFLSAVNVWRDESGLFAPFLVAQRIATDYTRYSDTGVFWIGPLWLYAFQAAIFSLLYSFYKVRTRISKISLVFFAASISSFIFWYYSSPVIRYLIPQIWIVFLWVTFEFKQRRVIGKILIVGLLAVGASKSLRYMKTTAPLKPPQTEEEVRSFLRVNIPTYEAYEYLEKNSDRDSVIYTIHDECQQLYNPRPHLGGWFGQGGLDELIGRTQHEIRTAMSSWDVSYVLVNTVVPPNPSFEKIMGEYSSCLRLEKEFKMALLYKLSRTDPACFDPNVPVLNSIQDMKKHHPQTTLPFWYN